MAWLENKAGQFIQPHGGSGLASLLQEVLPENLRAFFPDPDGPYSYPIVTYSWLLLYKRYDDPQKAVALKRFVTWCLTEGQAFSEPLGYVRLARRWLPAPSRLSIRSSNGKTVVYREPYTTRDTMNESDAITAFAALAQEHRLQIFRLLIRQTPYGLPAGQIGACLGISASTLSSHLAHLERAGLLRSWREHQRIFYAADAEGFRQLLGFLTEECCAGHPELCGYVPQDDQSRHEALLPESMRSAQRAPDARRRSSTSCFSARAILPAAFWQSVS